MTRKMNEEQFESVEGEGVCDDIPDYDWLLSATRESKSSIKIICQSSSVSGDVLVEQPG